MKKLEAVCTVDSDFQPLIPGKDRTCYVYRIATLRGSHCRTVHRSGSSRLLHRNGLTARPECASPRHAGRWTEFLCILSLPISAYHRINFFLRDLDAAPIFRVRAILRCKFKQEKGVYMCCCCII